MKTFISIAVAILLTGCAGTPAHYKNVTSMNPDGTQKVIVMRNGKATTSYDLPKGTYLEKPATIKDK